VSYWAEIRTAVRRTHAPRLVPLDQVDQHTGFRSVFAYDDATAERIREQGGTGGLRNVPVYADTLFLDFDGHDPSEFREWLLGSGLSGFEFDSGNRSVHFHIPMQPVFGAWVPRACKLWVKKHAPTADISFYHPAGVYRLEGTYHPKQPGRCKTLTGMWGGEALVLPEPAAERFAPAAAEETTPEQFYTMLLQSVAEGGRRPRAWLLATMAAECGMSFDEATDHLLWWNQHHCHPAHSADAIIKQVESAYRRLARQA
jgi:hypothetical protein